MILQIQPWIDEEELVQLKRVVETTFVTENVLTKEFEGLTKTLTGAKHAISMANGSLALFACLKALSIGPGDEVIVPDLTFIATANAIILAGATPVFCDVRPDTFCLDIQKAESLITSRTKAIMPVHLYGQSADMDEILNFARTYNLVTIEDAAQGVGVRFKNQHVGTFGELGILSYYGNKTITCGEGGIVLTNDDRLAQLVYRLKNHGRDVKGTFIHDHIGYNFSFTEMQAAIGVAQMHKLSRIVNRKAEINGIYQRELLGLSRVENVFLDPRSTPVFWFTSILTDNAEELGAFLLKKGIQSRRFFYPLHRQPCYSNFGLSPAQFPVSNDVFKRGLSLPSSYQLTESEQVQVIEAIKEYCK